MRPVVVVVRDLVPEDPFEVSSPSNQDPVQAFRSSRAHPSFGVSVCVRGPDRCADDSGPVRLEHPVEGGGELGVAVTDQEPMRRSESSRRCPLTFLACCVTQAESGLVVAPAMWTLLVFSSMKNST